MKETYYLGARVVSKKQLQVGVLVLRCVDEAAGGTVLPYLCELPWRYCWSYDGQGEEEDM